MLPTPGTMLQASRRMRAWEDDRERGVNGAWVKPGDIGLVVQSWMVGNRAVRLRLIVNEVVCVFSCDHRNLDFNWLVLSAGVTSSLGP